MSKKTDEECLVDAIMKDDADEASKKLDSIMQRKVAKKMKEVLVEEK